MKNNFYYICGCVRNCEEYLPKVFKNIKSISSLFDQNKYKIVIAYDKSSDKSLDILHSFKQELSDKLHIIYGDEKTRTSIRTMNISNARNSILEFIRNEEKIEKLEKLETYMIMMDCDDVCSKKINLNVLKTVLLKQNSEWDSVSFNLDVYYDIWALSIQPFLFSCWHFGDTNIKESQYVVNTMYKFITDKLSEKKDNLVECFSAFNGFAIYKLDKFIDCKYDWNINNIVQLLNSYDKSLLIKNQVFLRKKIKYISDNMEECMRDNSVVKKIEDCEHRHFHMQAIFKNNARIRISTLKLFE